MEVCDESMNQEMFNVRGNVARGSLLKQTT